jgi:FixJ family two-component response regulator
VSQTSLVACVDDDASVCEAIVGFLEALGFAVMAFPSAEDLLQFDRLGQVSCVITDVKLGGMSGLQLQDRLAASGHRTPTIVVTALSDERVRAQALSAGAVCFLSKPVSKEDLLAGIRSALRGQAAAGTRP